MINTNTFPTIPNLPTIDEPLPDGWVNRFFPQNYGKYTSHPMGNSPQGFTWYRVTTDDTSFYVSSEFHEGTYWMVEE